MSSPTAVVIPVYGHLDFARKATLSALRNTPNPLVIVVDDASPKWDPALFRDLPPAHFRLHRMGKNKGLTAAWNTGLRIARDAGAAAATVTNSDVLFPAGWWGPVEAALAEGVHLAGPATNAPGHRDFQRVSHFLPDYRLTDDPAELDRVQERLAALARPPLKGRVNGFCMAARLATWFGNAHSEKAVFDPRNRMVRQEDELQGRWRKRGLVTACVPQSFVFHYRGLTRKGATRGVEGRGHFRPPKG